MRILLAALTCPKGDIKGNLDRHLGVVARATQSACDLVVFPEMSLTGYRAGAAIGLEDPAVKTLISATAGSAAAAFGLAERPPDGGRPTITQVVAIDGRPAVVHRKAHLGEGEDADFVPGQPSGAVCVAGVRCSLAICAEIGTEAPYAVAAELVLAPAAPGLHGRRTTPQAWEDGYRWWRGSVLDDASRFAVPNGRWVAVATQAGATDDEDFPGWAAVIDPSGRPVAETADGRESLLAVDVPLPDPRRREV